MELENVAEFLVIDNLFKLVVDFTQDVMEIDCVKFFKAEIWKIVIKFCLKLPEVNLKI